ncbi:hypothetical protein AJ79_02556 [Helicocarpus griseus UAMH5409]|uniref:Uncharacterized protein n=1 Tax=Helicocarpus griseus UAMH5409 TaxID=1447875 RepID=A0A2B7Y2B6_9EURO|nr:hypothetical protein AJ79_02556 [Helicocarpus griseus UAMH5409]
MAKPQLPDGYENLSAVDKQNAREKFRLEQANLYYTAVTGLENELHLKHSNTKNLECSSVTRCLHPNVEGYLITCQPCPISFTPEEQQQALDDAAEWNESADMLSRAREAMGIDLEGGTEPGNFEYAQNMNLGFRMEMVRQSEEHERELAWRAWPYKDDDDTSLLPRYSTNDG